MVITIKGVLQVYFLITYVLGYWHARDTDLPSSVRDDATGIAFISLLAGMWCAYT